MRYFLPLIILIIFTTSCKSYKTNTLQEFQTDVVKASKNNDSIIQTSYDLFEIFEREKVIPFEPKDGIYLGANINNTYFNNDFKKFEKESGKKHAIYVYYITLDTTEAIIQKAMLQSILNNQIPYFVLKYDKSIGFNYNKIESLSRKLGQIKYDNLVEIMPFSNDYDVNKDDYVKFFRVSHDIFKENSSSSSIVFAYNNEDIPFTLNYYPGDNYCDFVSIYELNNGTEKNTTNPLSNIDMLYYSVPNKPIILNIAISYFDDKNNVYTLDAFEEKANNIYSNVIVKYNNIKAIVYNDFDNNVLINNNNMYNLESFNDAFKIYKTVIDNDFLLDSKVVEGVTKQEVLLPFEAFLVNEKIYIDTDYFDNYIYKYTHKTKTINNKIYLEMYDFINELYNKKIAINEEERKITIMQ